jgi:hypothetical protein
MKQLLLVSYKKLEHLQRLDSIEVKTFKDITVSCSVIFTIENTSFELCAVLSNTDRAFDIDFKAVLNQVDCPINYSLHNLLPKRGSFNC